MPQSKHRLPNIFYLSLVTVNPSLDIPLYRQIYKGLRDAIVDGRLACPWMSGLKVGDTYYLYLALRAGAYGIGVITGTITPES